MTPLSVEGTMISEPSVRVRRAGPSDAAELAELGSRTFRATYGADTPADTLASYVRAEFGIPQQADELEDPTCHVLVAERRGALIGYAVLQVAAPPIPAAAGATMQLSRLYVDEHEQGEGIGASLLDAAVALARARGHGRLWLTVWERNERAIGVYRRWGFVDAGTVTFDLAGETQVDRVLVLRIT